MPGKPKRTGPSAYYGEKGWRFVRLFRTLMVVVEAEKPLSVAEINERVTLDSDLRQFEGKIATTRDDLWILVRCHIPIRVTDEQGEDVDLTEYLDSDTSRRGKLKNTRWSLRPGGDIGVIESSHQRRPTAAELTTLSLMQALLRDAVPRQYPLYEQLAVLVEALQQWLIGRFHGGDHSMMIDRFVASGKKHRGTQVEKAVLRAAADGLRRERMVEGVYTLANRREVTLQVLPLAAWFSEGRAHLFGARGYDGGLRLYRLDRFRSLTVLPNGKKPKIDKKQVDRLLEGRFGGYVAEPQTVELHANASVAYLFDEYEFHPSQKVRARRDGSLTVTLQCAVSYALEEWILGFGEHVKVLEPLSLKERIAARFRKAAARYDSKDV